MWHFRQGAASLVNSWRPTARSVWVSGAIPSGMYGTGCESRAMKNFVIFESCRSEK